MKRAVFSEPMDCIECGAPIKAREEFDYCGGCGNPIHVGCAEFIGSEYFCPDCAEKVKKDIDRSSRTELHSTITKFLAKAQFRFWVDNEPETAQQANTQADRAVQYYLANVLFRSRIDTQATLIMSAIKPHLAVEGD